MGGHQRTHEGWIGLEHAEEVEVAGQRDAHGFAVADDIDTMGLGNVAIEVGGEVLEGLGIGAYEDVSVTETVGLSLLVEFHTQRHILDGDVGVAPPEENLRIDEQGEEEIDQYAANHDEQSLPAGLGTELVILDGLFHLFGIETLVNHARYLAIAAEGNPADAVLGVAILGFELEKTELPVEEKVELLDAYSEEFGEEKMAALMEQYQEADGQHEL